MKKLLTAGMVLCLLVCVFVGVRLTVGPFFGGPEVFEWETVWTYGDPSEENSRITDQVIGEENHLILPATASREAVTLYFDIPQGWQVFAAGELGSTEVVSGTPFDLTALCGGDTCGLMLEAKKGEAVSEYALKLSFADRIGTMYLVSEDPENEGRTWVEASPDKSNKAKGSMLLQNGDGSLVYSGGLTQIKGRGNSTWLSDKKPYQIKLSDKTDLLQTGAKDNASKTWVLLANYSDLSNMRNSLVYDLGLELGMDFCTENEWVNLYYDGEYRGCYLLSEKVEIGSGRVDITDLEELNEEANGAVELEDLPLQTGKTANGASYRYCLGMNSPADITGGYLLEMELSTRVEAEICWFTTRRGQNVVVKSPEFASREEMDYIATLFQEWEDALFSGGVHPETGKRYTDYVDLRSMAVCYLANELSKNQDGFRTSAFFYKDAGQETMYMGPLWDYDITLNFNGSMRPTGFDTARGWLGGALCEMGDFREEVRSIYLKELYPLLNDVYFGAEDAATEVNALRSCLRQEELLAASMACNSLLWTNTGGWEGEAALLQSFVAERAEYLKDELAKWSADTPFVMAQSLFADVDENAWYFEDVHKADEYGIMSGGGGDAFYPTTTAYHAHVVQTIYNMVGRPAVEFADVYTDVKPHDEWANATSWCVHNGLLTDMADGVFDPLGTAAREDVIAYLYRYRGEPAVAGGLLSGFADGDEVSDHARNAVEWALEEELLVTQDGLLRPRDAVRRAELASLLVRFYEKYING